MLSSSTSSEKFSPSPKTSSGLVNLASCSSISNHTTMFAPLHRTIELENLHDNISGDEEQIITSKKILTKCMTVIGDGSDKQI